MLTELVEWQYLDAFDNILVNFITGETCRKFILVAFTNICKWLKICKMKVIHYKLIKMDADKGYCLMLALYDHDKSVIFSTVVALV